MLSNVLFKMPFCVKMSNICVIRIVSAKTCVLVLLQGWGFRTLLHLIFALGAVVLQLFCLVGGDFALSKKFTTGQPGGC